MRSKSTDLEWVETLGKEITSTIEWQAPTDVEWYYSKADENNWGTDLLELYPAWQEIEEAGPNDGEAVYATVNHFDILEAQKVLSKLNAVAFSLDENQQPSVTLEGIYKGHEIVVIVHFAPIDDLDDEIE